MTCEDRCKDALGQLPSFFVDNWLAGIGVLEWTVDTEALGEAKFGCSVSRASHLRGHFCQTFFELIFRLWSHAVTSRLKRAVRSAQPAERETKTTSENARMKACIAPCFFGR